MHVHANASVSLTHEESSKNGCECQSLLYNVHKVPKFFTTNFGKVAPIDNPFVPQNWSVFSWHSLITLLEDYHVNFHHYRTRPNTPASKLQKNTETWLFKMSAMGTNGRQMKLIEPGYPQLSITAPNSECMLRVYLFSLLYSMLFWSFSPRSVGRWHDYRNIHKSI